MSDSPINFPSVETIVDWYFNPEHAVLMKLDQKIPKPTHPYDYQPEDPRELFKLTLEYLVAATPAIEHPRLRIFAEDNGDQNLFWPIHEVRVDPQSGNSTTIIIWYYGLDARGKFTLDTYYQKEFGGPYINEFSWPDLDDIPEGHRNKLLHKLKALRRSLVN